MQLLRDPGYSNLAALPYHHVVTVAQKNKTADLAVGSSVPRPGDDRGSFSLARNSHTMLRYYRETGK